MDDKKWYSCADEWFEESYIQGVLDEAKEKAKDSDYVNELLQKAGDAKGLTHQEAAVLLQLDKQSFEEKVSTVAKKVKERIYGKRIVLFAPLYVSDYCVNNCQYCGYKTSNIGHGRRRLTMDEVREEVVALEELGHKRLALELGEDPVKAPLSYVLECIDTIYNMKFKNGQIRRINVNIAATTTEEYKQLKAADIGTYILFQETYHKETYEKVHPTGPKHNYSYHTSAFHRAMDGGIGDVGGGVLFGLYDYKFETIAMLMHAERLEATYGVGPHTFSVPRLQPAENVTLENYPHLVDDESFKQLIAVLRLATPYVGIILSTRENEQLRREILELGISQLSAGSSTSVGGYSVAPAEPQFEIGDHRTPTQVLTELLETGYIPSYCTACYREGRTGERFMSLAKTGQIGNVCTPNALITLKEYVEDYGDDSMKALATKVINKEVETIAHEKVRTLTKSYLEKIEAGERDFRL